MLSDDAIEGVLPSLPQEDLWWAEYGGMAVRDHYEHLITTGKLRVVVECRVKVDNSPGEWNGMHLFGCNGRGPVTDEVFCPYCGGSIIKPTQQP